MRSYTYKKLRILAGFGFICAYLLILMKLLSTHTVLTLTIRLLDNLGFSSQNLPMLILINLK